MLGGSARTAALAATLAVLLASSAAYAQFSIPRANCKQYGGPAECWQPVIAKWKYGSCGEIGAFAGYSAAVCKAQGGTWGGAPASCQGLPAAEYRRPTSESDIVPFSKDIFANFYGPLCTGPDATGYSWGAPLNSVNCGTSPGATIDQFGYEVGNTTSPITVTGKRQISGVCNTTDTALNFTGSRTRQVGCGNASGAGSYFIFTNKGTPALCSLGFRQPINPKTCTTCDGKTANPFQVGNPINPSTGAKQQIDLDYLGTGPQPLRFERVYHSRVFAMDGRQWRHSYSAHIEHDTTGTRAIVFAHRPNGRTIQFPLTGGAYVADPDIDDRVTKLVDGGGLLTGWSYYDAMNDATEQYDAEGKLLSIANRAGLAQTLAYSTASTPPSVAPGPGFLLSVTDAFGRQLSFTYDLFGRMATMQDPAGQSYVYESTTQNHVASVTYPDGKKRTYLYNESAMLTNNNFFDGRMTGIVDENNSRLAWFYYDIFAIASRTTRASGVDNHVVNNGGWPSSVAVTDPRGTVRTYGYQQIQGVYLNSSITQPAASGAGTATSSTSYDANGNRAIFRDFNGNRTNFTHDFSRNLETSRTEALTTAGATTPQTRTISTQWHATFRLPTGIAEPLRITTNVYDPDGTACGAQGALCSRTIQATTDANGSQAFSATPVGTPRAWTYTYSANGSVLTVNGPRTDVTDTTTYTYYANNDADPGKRGNLATVTNAANHTTSITAYNLHGQPLTIVDPNGLSTTLAYDTRQRLTSRTAGTETTTYEYDSVGQLTKVTLPDGSHLSYTYDAAHRLTGMQDSQGNRIAYTLDALGNRTLEEVRDPSNNLAQTRSKVFNNLNRLFQELGALNQRTEYGYDNQGNVTSVKDPLDKVTTNAFDALNRLREVTDPGKGVTQYGYNGLDALTSVIDPRSLTTGYTVDGLGNLTLQSSPDTGNTASTHDAAGNLLTQTDAKNQTTSYAYDALNRVTLITFHDGSKQAYAYDLGTNGLGRLSSITETDPSSVQTSLTAYAYDQHGRVTSETRTLAGVAHVTSYSFGSNGRMTGMTYPSGRTLTYVYDAMGRINQISTAMGGQSQVAVENVLYHPFGGVLNYTLGNGQAYTRAVDTDGRIASYTLGGTAFGITFDSSSRITGIAETGNPPNTNTYGYDALDRLTSATLPSSSFGYSYDAVGNRLTKVTGAATDTYAYSSTSNRIATITPASGPVKSFVFDANGSTTDDGVNTYAYDTRGRMAGSTNAAALATSYQVNALGQRVRKTNSTSDTVFHFDTRGKLIAETQPAGGPIREYIYLGDIPVAVARPGSGGSEYAFLHVDHLNTPRFAANSTQQPVWRWDQMEPFGNNPPDENPSGLGVFEFSLRDEGTYFDKETNLIYNWNRYRNPNDGRFIQADPLGLNGDDLSLYVLRGNDPLSFTDPYGLRRGGARTSPNTALCDYYQEVCTSTGCRYYCYTAPTVCRGADYNPMFMWNGTGKLNCVRQCLIEEDQKQRRKQQSMCVGNKCLPDDVIDDYHQRCFTKCQASGYPGVDPWWYPGPRLNPPN